MGISLSQAKKDAKRLAKTHDIPLHEAQAAYAQEVSLKANGEVPNTWNKLTAWTRAQGECLGVLSFHDRSDQEIKLPVYENKPIVLLSGNPGSGKTFALNSLVDKWTKNDQKVHYFDYRNAYSDLFLRKNKNLVLYPFNERHFRWSITNKDLCRLYTDIMKIDLKKGDILIIDQMARFMLAAEKFFPTFLEDIIELSKEKGVILCLVSQNWQKADLDIIKKSMACYLIFWTNMDNRIPRFLKEHLSSKNLSYVAPESHQNYSMYIEYSKEYLEMNLSMDEQEQEFIYNLGSRYLY